MDCRARPSPHPGAGLFLIPLLVLMAVGLAAGWGWLVALAAIGVLDVAAVVAGTDSRAPGDWRGAGSS